MADAEKPKRGAQGAASPASPKRVRAAAKQVQAMQLREAGVSFDKMEKTGLALSPRPAGLTVRSKSGDSDASPAVKCT